MNTKAFARIVFATLILLTASGLQMQFAVADSSPKAYGRKLIAEYDVPPETIEKYRAFQPSAPQAHESALTNALLAKTEDWHGPQINGDAVGNPYAIVVTLTGTAKADGPAATLWNAGWAIYSENGDQTRSTVLPGLAKTEAKAGETFSVTAAATPVSFKEDRKVAVSLALVNARNIDIQSVHVQVWSGMAPTSWLEFLGPLRWALLGVVLIVIWWVWIKR